MSILSAEKISKSYSEKILFNDISIGINEGEKIGLIGINGTGKSTLLKVLAGFETYDAGRIIYGNGTKIEYLPQNPIFEPGTTALEQIFKGSSPVMILLREYEAALQDSADNPEDSGVQRRLISLSQRMDTMQAWTYETEAKSVLTKLGITDFKADVGTLSGGQKKRIAIAGALITPSDLLILDEPTNHIDNDTVDWLEKYLNKRKGALLLVTHDRYLLDRIVNRMIELDGSKIYSYQANYSKYLEMKAEREELAEASEKKRQGLIRRELEWIRRGARARSTKQKARIDRFDNLIEQKGPSDNESVEMQVSFSRLGKKIININNISKSFPCGEIIRNFNYNLLRDDRIGIIGPNGSGKSTLLKIMSGRLEPDSGEVSIGETVKIGYFSQENDDIDNSSLRVIEYIREQAEYVTTEEGTISASQMLEKFLFPPVVQWTPISKLSGGEKRRLHLLRVLMSAPNVLMLDEPTNDLDIQTLTILESYLDDFPGAVIVVSHDRYFLDRVVDGIFSFEGSGEIKQYIGNYSDYRDTVAERELLDEGIQMSSKAKINEKTENKKDKPLKFTFKEQREFDEIDDKIAALENALLQVETKINEASSDFVQLQQLLSEKEKLGLELEDAINRWAQLNELFEEIERSKRDRQ
jgi:ATP-binding cassette subfamily F protein uup